MINTHTRPIYTVVPACENIMAANNRQTASTRYEGTGRRPTAEWFIMWREENGRQNSARNITLQLFRSTRSFKILTLLMFVSNFITQRLYIYIYDHFLWVLTLLIDGMLLTEALICMFWYLFIFIELDNRWDYMKCHRHVMITCTDANSAFKVRVNECIIIECIAYCSRCI